MGEYRDKHGPIFTIFWSGNKKREDKPLVGIIHSAHDGTTQFETRKSMGTVYQETGKVPLTMQCSHALRPFLLGWAIKPRGLASS